MRLNKFLAHAGVASRRKADELIRAATTSVNGEIVTDPALDVTSEDKVIFDGRRIAVSESTVVYMLHKPKGYITSVGDPHGRKTVMDLMAVKERIFPVGRLDKDTTGLLLLTNDGELSRSLLLPKNKIPRKYELVIDRQIQPTEIQKLKRGIHVWDGEKGRAKVVSQKTVKKRTTAILELTEGKKREIRRMMSRMKIKLFSLHRNQFGPITLGSLQEGEVKLLSEKETMKLRSACKTKK